MSAEVAARAAEHGRFAIDTEFVAERRYQAMLCLAQVAVPDPGAADGVRTEVLDPLDGLDPRPLAAALADPAIEVVLHAGRQDVAILRRSWATEVRSIFDTQVAAGVVGFGLQEGDESLVRKLLGGRLRGSEGVTRWDRRPLTKAQLGDALEERLREAGRLEWAREESRALEAASDERDPDRLFERLPRLRRLEPIQRAVARELVAWREATARAVDRPAASVLPDHAVVEVARQLPRDRPGLEQIRGLPAQTLRRRGDELVAAVARGRQAEPPPPPPEPGRRDRWDGPLMALAGALVRQRSLESGVAAELIATQSELGTLVAAVRESREPSGSRVVGGWRRRLVGAELLELLAGRRTLSVDRGRLRVSG